MFDAQRANDHIDFLQLLKLTGDFYGKPFELLPWQKEIIANVYGTLTDDGRRQYKYAYLELPKKNGKTELIAGMAIAHCLNDGPSGQIYCCAAEREQASLVYIAAKQKIEQDEYLESVFRVVDSKKEIHNTETGTFIKVLSAEAYSKHGLNPTVVIFDELHALQKRDLWDVMTFGSGAARKEQLIWVITTAGDDPDRKSVGWEQHDYARKVRDGEIVDPSWYVKIYSYEGDDIYNEANWYSANPSLGITIDIENVRQEALAAKNSEAAERLFRWLRLNQWIATKQVGWLPITLWDKTETDKWTRASLRGRECYMGIDLSSTTDLTATALLFPPRGDEPWRFTVDAWIPEANIKDREERDHVPFSSWIRDGYVHATPGECVDFAVLARHIEQTMREYNVLYLCADRWRIEHLAAFMSNEVASSKIIEIPQTIEGLSPAMKEIERLMYAGEIEHDHNPCGRWAFGNVRVAMDGNENLKPHKGRSIDRIDPIMALIDAMAAAIRLEQKKSVYETRGLRAL